MAAVEPMDMAQEWNEIAESMEIDEVISHYVASRYLVLDTNVLISFLPLLKALAAFLSENSQLGLVEFLIAGIVVDELDSKKRATADVDRVSGRSVGLSAREASNWLLGELKERRRTGKGLVRGQAHNETRQSSGNWRACMFKVCALVAWAAADCVTYEKESNDDVILDACLYFSKYRSVYLLSGDVNLSNKAMMNDIPAILCQKGWNFMQIYAAITPELQGSSFASIHASTAKMSQTPVTRRQTAINPPDGDESMLVDDWDRAAPGPSTVGQQATPPNLLDAAHAEICARATDLLRAVTWKAVVVECERLRAGGTDASVYSPARSKGFASIEELPTQSQVTGDWDVRQCLSMLQRLAPPGSTLAGDTNLGVFLTPAGQRGARRGRDWSRGDWVRAASGLGAVGEAFDDKESQTLGAQVVSWIDSSWR